MIPNKNPEALSADAVPKILGDKYSVGDEFPARILVVACLPGPDDCLHDVKGYSNLVGLFPAVRVVIDSLFLNLVSLNDDNLRFFRAEHAI